MHFLDTKQLVSLIQQLINNYHISAVGLFWAFFGLLEILSPSLARFLFERLKNVPRVMPLLRLAMGLLLVLGAIRNEIKFQGLIVLAILTETVGAIGILLSEDKLKEYIHWLKSRPKLTFRLIGLGNLAIGLYILRFALS